MNWNSIPNAERLHLWKKLRQDIKGRELKEQLKMVATFFSEMPYSARTLDYYEPSTWPTPWEIIYNGAFCKSSISLLMFHTLLTSNIDTQLILINDGADVYLLPLVDKTYVLNYQFNSINEMSDIADEIKVKQIIDNKQIKQIV